MFRTVSQNRDGQPLIVYLPGIDGLGALANQFLSEAETRFSITQLHYPGHSRLTLEELADGCVSALPEKKQSGIIWLGDSFGAAIALTIARRHPQVTQGVILAGGFSKAPSPFKLLTTARLWDSCPGKWRKQVVRRSLNRLARKNPAKIQKNSIDEILSNGHLEEVPWRLRLLAAFDMRQEIQRIETPVLYLGGEEDGQVDTHEESRYFRENCPLCRTFLFPGCGHAVLLERPSECLEVIELFVPIAKRAAA
ncbi:MAG: alpha/beta hydrolase [Candidatus Omnitrophica bacterium]|nr:alpha/beta hydrolase [Candidatus Omnitrophota bacterium]